MEKSWRECALCGSTVFTDRDNPVYCGAHTGKITKDEIMDVAEALSKVNTWEEASAFLFPPEKENPPA